MAGTTGSAREEAERLVATVLAMAAQSGLGGAARGGDDKDDTLSRTGARVAEGIGALGDTLAGLVGQVTGASGGDRAGTGTAPTGTAAASGSATGDAPGGGHAAGAAKGWATGSAECCVCPVCKAIVALRDPSPHAAERLAAGAGDFAIGVASLLRAFSAVTSARPAKPARSSAPRPAPAPPDPDQAWSTATRTSEAAARTSEAAVRTSENAARTSEASARTGEDQTSEAAGRHERRAGGAPAGADAARSGATGGTGRQGAVSAATDAWAAATASSAAGVEEERRAAAAAKAAARAEADAERAAEAARRADADVAGAARAAAGQKPEDGALPAAGAPVQGGGIGPDLSASAGGPRTKDGVKGDGRSRSAPGGDVKGDVWAAATADHRVRGLAQSPGVDHDDPGPPARAGRADTGPVPAAEAAEDPATDPGDDARGGARGVTT